MKAESVSLRLTNDRTPSFTFNPIVLTPDDELCFILAGSLARSCSDALAACYFAIVSFLHVPFLWASLVDAGPADSVHDTRQVRGHEVHFPGLHSQHFELCLLLCIDSLQMSKVETEGVHTGFGRRRLSTTRRRWRFYLGELTTCARCGSGI